MGRRYELQHLIGQGGFGRVYRGRQIGPMGFGKQVAIKIVDGSLDSQAVERLRHEAWILSLVRHRAVVQVDDLVPLEGACAVVMEYVEGVDLSHVIGREPMPLSVAAEIVMEVAGALACAGPIRSPQGRPLLLQHRDIKPANIMITPQGGTKLLDFGIAWAVVNADGGTQRAPYGSRGYVAPERMRREDHFNSDIFALGVVFWEMLTGERFGVADREPAAHAEHVQRALSRLGPGTPPAARRLLGEMLGWDADARPPAREVERRASDLARSSRPTLRDWVEGRLPARLEPTHLPSGGEDRLTWSWSTSSPFDLEGPPIRSVRPTLPPSAPAVDPAAPTAPRGTPPPARPRTEPGASRGSRVAAMVLGLLLCAIVLGAYLSAEPAGDREVRVVPGTAVEASVGTPRPTR